MSERRFGSSLPVRHLWYAAATLTFLVATLHLFHPEHGFLRLVRLLGSDPALLFTHPRPIAFVLSGFALVVGVNAVLLGFPKKPIYALGMALMIAYVVGYFAWHLTGHGGFLPGRPANYHGVPPHEAVINHLAGDAWAAASVVTEAVLFGILALLYREANATTRTWQNANVAERNG